KRYRLACANEINAFFVAEEFWTGPFAESEADLPDFRKAEPKPVYLFSGYDGTVLLSSESKLGWHNFPIRCGDVQVLPKYLRRFPNDHSWLQRKLFTLVRRTRNG